jgi:hypothetical protein
MTKSIDPRKAKIRELKTSIKQGQDELSLMIAAEIKEEDKEKQKTDIMVKKTLIQNMQIELKQVRDNKLSSRFFEFTPTPPNRAQARNFRKNRKHARNLSAV